ncbi:MAG: hypothetical protein AB7L13_11770 [Acidimicrobiia bacterium]
MDEPLTVDELTVLHTVAICGTPTPDDVGAFGGDTASVDRLVERALVRFDDRIARYKLTPDGRALHRSLAGDREGETLTLRLHYAEFRKLDRRCKQLCTDWQLTPDAAVIDRLVDWRQEADALLDRLAIVNDRFSVHRRRITDAVERVRGGDHTAFTGVWCASVHDVWMVLHEDLVLTLGIDRRTENDE